MVDTIKKLVTLIILLVVLLLCRVVPPVQAQPLKTSLTRSEIMTQQSHESQENKAEKTEKQHDETQQKDAKETTDKSPRGVVPPGGYHDEATGITYQEGENVIIP